MTPALSSARIIDSHTGGEPTRVLIEGGPELGGGSMAIRRDRMARDHDAWRRALIHEPRGNSVLVGALLCEPHSRDNTCGVVFFNDVGYLGMCGHGTIGVIASLHHLGRVEAGIHRIETPVGVVEATLHESGEVSVTNVPSYRWAKDVVLELHGGVRVHGDVAWGGNWFFLCEDHGLSIDLHNVERLSSMCNSIRTAMESQGVRGADGALIDHVELLGPPCLTNHDGRSFVMCPGGAYDRSPCGTGTSAKLACLAADGALLAGQMWHQESVIGSVFAAQYEHAPAREDGLPTIRPTIRGRAHVTLDARLVFDPSDSFAWGLDA